MLAGLYLWVGWTFLPTPGTSGRIIAIGSKNFTEQYVLAALLAAEVAADDGPSVRQVQSLGSTVAFDALRAGEIDLYVDYSGTIWATILKRQGLPQDRSRVLAEATEELASGFGIEVLATLGFENTYALAMREPDAAGEGVASLSDLARRSGAWVMGADYEFFARAEWQALEERYGLGFAEERSMDPALMYSAIAEGEVDVISAFSTDGRIATLGLRVLRDDLGVIPPYDAIVLARPGFRRQWPAVAERVRGLSGRIDASAMQQMNREVDQEGNTPRAVAEAFRAQVLESR